MHTCVRACVCACLAYIREYYVTGILCYGIVTLVYGSIREYYVRDFYVLVFYVWVYFVRDFYVAPTELIYDVYEGVC